MSKGGKKKIIDRVKMQIPAGKANPAPPIGTALGPRKVNMMEFCKSFNEQTKKLEPGVPVRVVLSIYEDRSFSFVTKSSPTSYYLKKFAKINKGSAQTKKIGKVGSITKEQAKEIAQIKLDDMNSFDLDAALKMVEGSAESMGITIKG